MTAEQFLDVLTLAASNAIETSVVEFNTIVNINTEKDFTIIGLLANTEIKVKGKTGRYAILNVKYDEVNKEFIIKIEE